LSKVAYPLKEKLLETYDESLNIDGICGERVAKRLHEIAQIGLTKDGGSNRPGFSKEELQAKQLVMKWMEEAGLTVVVDGAGNVFGRLAGKNDHKKAIISGSHVDSVPNGGHFDGVLGVVAALEVAEAWKETGYVPERPYEVVIFSDEEGARFNSGLLGSKAAVGAVSLDELLTFTDFQNVPFKEVLEKVGLDANEFVRSARDYSNDELYIEVHIEQGKRLEKNNLPCGIVSGIAGPYWIECTITGAAGHAGNTPMNDRRDALVAASEFIQAIHHIPEQISDSAVATVGKLEVNPNGINIIPGEVQLTIDTRDITRSNQEALGARIKEVGTEIRTKYGVDITFSDKAKVPPLEIRSEYIDELKEVFHELNIDPMLIPSGAGHDAMVIGEKIPSLMIFVQSKDGISHRPDEWSELNDCVQAIHVLKKFIEKRQ